VQTSFDISGAAYKFLELNNGINFRQLPTVPSPTLYNKLPIWAKCSWGEAQFYKRLGSCDVVNQGVKEKTTNLKSPLSAPAIDDLRVGNIYLVEFSH